MGQRSEGRVIVPVAGGMLLTHYGLSQWYGYDRLGAVHVTPYKGMRELEETAKTTRFVRGPFIATSRADAMRIYNEKRRNAKALATLGVTP